ncbi:hypothetical protein NQ315_006827 [Exocentrus adspersus]|uniref:endo-polygalacturonase n=1 Tax=Exocentrus adspersus TaxID=1586481 RepID=A0AAV8WDD8_9CUCU|nr:hypothetical protein NQ315_006827 [Exocentrus adspersus]
MTSDLESKMASPAFLLIVLASISVMVSASPNKLTAESCTITKYNADVILAAQAICNEITIKGISVTAGETLDLSQLKSGSKVIFDGTITWEYAEWRGPLLRISGEYIEVTGTADHVLDGRGHLWWDGLGGAGAKQKPRFFSPNGLNSSEISNLYIKNTPIHVFQITNCDDLMIQNVTIDNRDGDTKGGHNTDGFDIGNSRNVTIRHSRVYNQDDCLAVKSGKNYHFLNNFCSGGHGISIGSVGNVSIESVYMLNSHVENSSNGIRIKTIYGEVGSVSNILFENISFTNITDYGIIIEADYLNGGPTGVPTGGVPITDLTIKNITGTVLETGSNVYVLVKSASNWKCSEIDITGGKVTKECQGIPPDSVDSPKFELLQKPCQMEFGAKQDSSGFLGMLRIECRLKQRVFSQLLQKWKFPRTWSLAPVQLQSLRNP